MNWGLHLPGLVSMEILKPVGLILMEKIKYFMMKEEKLVMIT